MPPRLRVGACLSLTGPYARFGRQAGDGLRAWRALTEDVELDVLDDAGEPGRLRAGLAELAGRCDLLLGPYSTRLMRAAGRAIEGTGGLLWNHGGAGDDVQTSPGGRVVSVLTPAGRYAEPFLRRIAGEGARALWIVQGRGTFGRQVAEGAEAMAHGLGLRAERHTPDDPPPGIDDWRRWDVLSAGTFEDDVAAVGRLRGPGRQPRSLCTVAGGVGDFAGQVVDPDGVYGIAQWFPGEAAAPRLGPAEADFLAAYRALAGREPDYPAVQAAAGAAIAVDCARAAGGVGPDALRAAALRLDAETLFGPFRVDASGRQVGHRTVLVRWTGRRLVRAS